MWQDEIALVYDAAAQRGIGPLEADELEMWVLAAALGGNRADEDDESDPLADEAGLTWGERQARAIALGLPMPKFDEIPLAAKEIADQKKLMGLVPPIGPTTLPDSGG